MGQIGKDHWGSSGPASLIKQGHPMAQDCIQVVPPSGEHSRPSLGSLFQCYHLHTKVLPHVQVEIPGHQSLPIVLSHCWAQGAELGPCSDPSLQTLTHRDEVPSVISSSGWTAPAPSAFPHERCSSPLIMGSHPLAAFALSLSNGSRVMAGKSYVHTYPNTNTAYFVYLE